MNINMLQTAVTGSAQTVRAEPGCRREGASTHVILEFPVGQNG